MTELRAVFEISNSFLKFLINAHNYENVSNFLIISDNEYRNQSLQIRQHHNNVHTILFVCYDDKFEINSAFDKIVLQSVIPRHIRSNTVFLENISQVMKKKAIRNHEINLEQLADQW